MPFTKFTQNIISAFFRHSFFAVSNYKYYKRWKQSLVPPAGPVNDKMPWITFAATDYLEKHLQPGNKVFEYGGGGSTLFFLKKEAVVVTAEHNPEWFTILKDTIRSNNWQGNLIEAETKPVTENLSPANPDDFYSADEAYADKYFKSYCSYINNFENNYFDIVLVDGRARTSCIKQAMPKVKTGGLLIIDNAERLYYTEKQLDTIKKHFTLQLNIFGAVPYSPDFSKTAIWVKK
jgi:hypothetical protein